MGVIGMNQRRVANKMPLATMAIMLIAVKYSEKG